MSTRKYKHNKHNKSKHHKFRSKKIRKYRRHHKKTHKKYKGGNPVINFMNQGFDRSKLLLNKGSNAFGNHRLIKKLQKMGNVMHDNIDKAEAAENKVKSIKEKLGKLNNKMVKEKQNVQKLQQEITTHQATLAAADAVAKKTRAIVHANKTQLNNPQVPKTQVPKNQIPKT